MHILVALCKFFPVFDLFFRGVCGVFRKFFFKTFTFKTTLTKFNFPQIVLRKGGKFKCDGKKSSKPGENALCTYPHSNKTP